MANCGGAGKTYSTSTIPSSNICGGLVNLCDQITTVLGTYKQAATIQRNCAISLLEVVREQDKRDRQNAQLVIEAREEEISRSTIMFQETRTLLNSFSRSNNEVSEMSIRFYNLNC